ncbi:TetR/AcrR family transcriptional regulator [Plantactinospora soyae]|uniref:TetR/AcrR family transcriptional repressor of lmrAB and yxaGH operons n=1 Tax=Plantactinospora soyae TaxID=1544732 RepID=A0A927M8Z8_9ACTN|nr:TetR/AcrR family transcriptional regulator [Plantactinospora soyae]MBE1490207.1 TetR/AcrR family transcriptional repressor of lmrAB and yxaGH operons [Plantactinospora soyae]
MAKGQETRQRMVRTAAELFPRQGYHATGLNQLLSEARAPKGSLYFHFPGGKEQVAVEAIGMSGVNLLADLRDALDEAADPAEGIVRVVELLAARLAASGYLDGCPVASVALDAAGSSEAIRVACTEAYDGWLGVIEAALRRWGVPAARSGVLATVLLSAVEGALLLARVRRDTRPLHAVADELEPLVSSAVPA